MKTSIKRVNSKKEFEAAVEDAQIEGWKLETRGDNVAVLKKHGGFGSIFGHAVVFIFTVWWTFFLGNLAYAGFRYLSGAKELRIKMN